MPILTSLRQSPTYLYVKVYCLCALVTLFQAAPVSSRIPQLGQTLQLNKYRVIRTRLGPRIVPVEEAQSIPANSIARSSLASQDPHPTKWFFRATCSVQQHKAPVSESFSQDGRREQRISPTSNSTSMRTRSISKRIQSSSGMPRCAGRLRSIRKKSGFCARGKNGSHRRDKTS